MEVPRIIRASNLKAKIVFHIHAEWFSQSNLTVVARRLRSVDRLLTISHYVTRKTQHNVRAIANRCQTMYNSSNTSSSIAKRTMNQPVTERKYDFYISAVFRRTSDPMFKIVAARYPWVRLDIVGPQGFFPTEECFVLNDQTRLRSVAPFFDKERVALLKRRLELGSSDQGIFLHFLAGT